MANFDATSGAQISKQIQDAVERPKIGRVVEVFEHVEDGDDSNFEVDIDIISSRDKQLRAIPWQAPQTGEIKVPKVGDKVIVEFRGQSKKIPIARNAVYTNTDRPPKGLAGEWKKRVESGSSPAGDGDLYVETYTQYDENPASAAFDPNAASPNHAYVRLAKKADDLDDSSGGLPVNIELYDDPQNGDAYATMELNKDGGSDSSATWGVKFDLSTGEFKILDANGYGIVSDGDGNFTWHYESIDYSQGTTDSL